ncbi:hypothetical protein HYD61_02720 [Mycoplasmopsis bovis]|nr:hypothetical protein HYD61_02720 [Mycoplasmopsis bovis]
MNKRLEEFSNHSIVIMVFEKQYIKTNIFWNVKVRTKAQNLNLIYAYDINAQRTCC